jgi:p-hydroxybenzoate 3-monooxygenase
VLESRDRAYVEARQRAGVIEEGTADLLRALGLGARMDRDGLVHGGIYLQFEGERHHVDFRDLTGGGTVTVWAQTEIVKDLVAARVAAGLPLVFEAEALAVSGLTGERPVVRWRDATGAEHDLHCDVVAGCDGFHGISRAAVPALRTWERNYPFAWLGILADVAPSTDELIYAHTPRGFSLHSMRNPRVSRLYLQVPPDEDIDGWPDERIWDELTARLTVPGWTLERGPVREKGVTPMRSFVSAPMRHGRLLLAGDAAHIVPPTGAKGLNLALADARDLAAAMVALLRDADPAPLDSYSDRCLRRVWRATHFSWWMTSMLHKNPEADAFDGALQLSQLRYVTTSRAAAASLAENYVGYTIGGRT